MASEIRATGYLSITRNGFTTTGNTARIVDMSGSNYSGTVYTIGTSYWQIPTGSCNDLRYLFVSNESTASVEISYNSTSSSFATLQSGDVILLPPSASFKTYFVKATLPNSDVQIVLTES